VTKLFDVIIHYIVDILYMLCIIINLKLEIWWLQFATVKKEQWNSGFEKFSSLKIQRNTSETALNLDKWIKILLDSDEIQSMQ